MSSTDPLLQPFQLKHLTLKNRIMTTSHEPAYPEDGMPKGRYRANHVERAKAGVALTMTAGSAAVSRDSPPVFNNVLAFKDEVVPWMRDLADACHEYGAAVMIQLTHLGRRTRWDKNFWLPVVSPSLKKEAAHRAFPKKIEDWDIARIIKDYADAAERMYAAGLDGIRADEEQGAGFIHKLMYERILLSEYAIADLTLLNANVYYELGIRHAARPETTHGSSRRIPRTAR